MNNQMKRAVTTNPDKAVDAIINRLFSLRSQIFRIGAHDDLSTPGCRLLPEEIEHSSGPPTSSRGIYQDTNLHQK